MSPKGIYPRKKQPTELQKQILEELRKRQQLPKKQQPTYQQIAKKLGCTKEYIRYVKNRYMKAEAPEEKIAEEAVEEAKLEPTEQPIEIEPTPPVIPPPELTEELGEVAPAITKAVKEGILTQQQITSIFQSVNELLPPKYQRPKKSMELLGSVWEKPLNRMMEKYIDENIDLYVAVIVTIVIFAPVPIQYARDRAKKKKVKKPELNEYSENTR